MPLLLIQISVPSLSDNWFMFIRISSKLASKSNPRKSILEVLPCFIFIFISFISLPQKAQYFTSLFKTSADASSEVTLASLALPEVKKAIQSGSVEVPIFKEIVFKNDTGKVYAASSILSVFIPSVFTENVSSLFEKDFSFFTYVDKTDVWPGVVLKLAVGADITAAKAEIAKLEINNEIGSLFFSQPGTASVWKDGKVGSFAGRYIPFSTKGFAFNYAWVNDYLILSTSYVGEQAAVKNLGF